MGTLSLDFVMVGELERKSFNRLKASSHSSNHMMKKDDATHKPIGGWIGSKSNQTKKNRVLKNFLFQGSYHKLLLEPIFNQSLLTQNPFVKVLIQKNIFFKLQQIDQEYNEKET